MERPLVSVIIPSFNRSHVLRLCVGAIQAQTYSPIEIIVVDDCGTEDAAEVASSMGATVLRTEVNGGASPARNLGAEHSHGEILLFLDGDIALDPDSVENAVNILRSEPKLGALGGILHPEPLASRSLAAQYRALQMHYWWMPTDRPTLELHAAVLAVPAEVFKEIGPFNPNLSDTVSADYRYRVMQKEYEVRITAAVCGRADHDSTLRMILRKVFRRARVSAMEWARGETPGDSVPRAFGGVLLLAAVPALRCRCCSAPSAPSCRRCSSPPPWSSTAAPTAGCSPAGACSSASTSAPSIFWSPSWERRGRESECSSVSWGGGRRALSGSPDPVTWRVNNAGGDRDLRPSHDLQVSSQTRHDHAMAVLG